MSVTVEGNKLSTEGLRVEVPGTAGALIIELGPSSGVSGTYDQTRDVIGLRQLTATELLLKLLQLPVGRGQLRLDAPSTIQNLELDGEIPLPNTSGLFGRVSLHSLSVQKAHFNLGTLQISGVMHVDALVCEQSRHNARRLTLARAQLTGVEVQLNGRTLHINRVVLGDVDLAISAEGVVTFNCGKAEAGTISMASAGASFELEGIRLPRGVRLEQNILSCQVLEVGSLRITLPALAKAHGGKAASSHSGSGGSFSLPDLPFLDDVEGRLDADVTIDISLPIIKSRRATHSLRLAIEGGAINFKQLERSMAGFEDAVLDFEVTEDALIFERDIVPGITFDNQTLVSWPLQGRDHELAQQQKKVRLRKLLDYRVSKAVLAKPDKAPTTEKPVRLRHFDVDNLNLELHIGGATELTLADLGTLRLGNERSAAIDRLKLQGSLHYSPEQPRDATELNLEAEQILLGAVFPNLLGRRTDVEALEVTKLERARVRLLGFQPVSASATIHGIRVSRLTVHDAIR